METPGTKGGGPSYAGDPALPTSRWIGREKEFIRPRRGESGIHLAANFGTPHLSLDVWYRTNTLSKCVAGATIPTAVPTPSAALARRAAAKKTAPASPCPAGAGWAYCNDRCVNILSDIEHCGGCSDAGGVDCGSLTDGDVQCVQGKCVVAY